MLSVLFIGLLLILWVDTHEGMLLLSACLDNLDECMWGYLSKLITLKIQHNVSKEELSILMEKLLYKLKFSF